jgi:hypothetical protein
MPDTTTIPASEHETDASKVSIFVLATLRDGSRIVSPFTKLAGLESYSKDVFAQRKPFNAWQIVSTRHPVSGEAGVLQRRRRLISGDQIVELEEVKPKEGITNLLSLNPEDYEPVLHLQRGEGGFHVFTPAREATELAPAVELPEGAVPGVEYPIHREPDGYGYVRYVILRAEGMDGEGSPELRHYLDQRREPTTQYSGDADDDLGDEGGEDDGGDSEW